MKSLPGFAVNRVGSSPGAELLQFDTSGRGLHVLDRGVIAAHTLGASEQDDEVNQEEILRLISERSFEAGPMRGS